MTTLNDARKAVYNQFTDNWIVDGTPLSPFCFDNETMNGELTWARCSVRSMPGGQSTLGQKGNRKYHRKGLARVEVYVPPASGLSEADRLCRAAAEMFEGSALAGLKFYDATTAEVGLVDDDRWFLSTVSVNFDYEEIK